MYNNESTVPRQSPWIALPVCWLILLGGYLLIRMVFLIFGLQLHLAAQGACLVLLPFLFGALYFLGAYLCGVNPLRVFDVMKAVGRAEPYAVLFPRMPMRYVVNLLFFNLTYILCGIAFAALCAFGLSALQKREAA